MTKSIIVVVAAVLLLGISPIQADEFSDHVGFLPDGPTITRADITKAQKMWGDAVVAIGKAGDKAPAVAEEAARTAYAFDLGPIQFKPTLAAETPFRPDLEGTSCPATRSSKKIRASRCVRGRKSASTMTLSRSRATSPLRWAITTSRAPTARKPRWSTPRDT